MDSLKWINSVIFKVHSMVRINNRPRINPARFCPRSIQNRRRQGISYVSKCLNDTDEELVSRLYMSLITNGDPPLQEVMDVLEHCLIHSQWENRELSFIWNGDIPIMELKKDNDVMRYVVFEDDFGPMHDGIHDIM